MKQTFKITIKLLFAATTILVVGALFLMVNPNEKVELIKPVKADIYSFTGIDSENNFRRAIEGMGIKPRSYDLNGNVMYFGNGSVSGSGSAAETAYKVQEQLVASGVNSKNYLGATKDVPIYDPKASAENKSASKELREAIMAGEVMPFKQGKNIQQMTSMMGLGSLEKFKKKTNEMTEQEIRNTDPSSFIKGYRYIEVNQSDNSTNAEIIAIWTDEDYDAAKLLNKKGVKQSAPDPTVPACIGCERMRRFQALEKSEPYNMNKWGTNSTVSDTYDFYVQAMGNRGWKESGKQKMLNKYAELIPSIPLNGGRGLSLEKDGKIINITILPDDKRGTSVFSIEQYLDTQTYEKSKKAN